MNKFTSVNPEVRKHGKIVQKLLFNEKWYLLKGGMIL